MKHTFEYPHTAEELAANEWIEITEEDFYWLLECVPPRWQGRHGFAVGEALCHMDNGVTVYTIVAEVGKRFFRKPGVLPVDQKAMVESVRKQFSFN